MPHNILSKPDFFSNQLERKKYYAIPKPDPKKWRRATPLQSVAKIGWENDYYTKIKTSVEEKKLPSINLQIKIDHTNFNK